MKKWKTAAVAASLVALLAGCASTTNNASDSSTKDVTLTYGVWSQDATMQKLIDAFEVKNPHIHVKLQVQPFGDYWTKLQVAATGGTAPDAFWMLGDHFQLYASGGQLLDLTKTIKDAKVDMSVYPTALVDMFKYQGKQYGLPKDFDTVGLWYNKALFDKAGVKYPDNTWTWATVQAAAKKLTNPKTHTYGIAAPLNRQEAFYNTIAQAGGYVLSKDGKTSGYSDAATQAGLQYWVDFIKNGSSPSLKQMTDTEAVAMFENQTVAMYYGGSFYANRFYDNKKLLPNINVAKLPTGKTDAVTINGIQNVGYSKTKHPAELSKFLLFLGGKQAAEIQADTGTVIPAYKGTQEAWVKSMPDIDAQVFLDQVPNAVLYPVSANTSVWNDEEYADLTPAWQGTESVQDAANKLAKDMNAALAKE
jgi:multiple sugar transport system substrate-binding protein